MFSIFILLFLVPSLALKLHGTQSSRSPLVNWYLLENEVAFEMAPPRPSNHPFGQVPFLTDGLQDEVEVFESGAILLYLADKYGGYNSPEARAAYTKWVVWSNSELDFLCFGKADERNLVQGTSLGKPSKALDRLDRLLGEQEYVLGEDWSVADCAVASYLNYVPVFFRDASTAGRSNLAAYMRRNAQRPCFVEAFGEGHAGLVVEKTSTWIDSAATSGAAATTKKGGFKLF